MIDENDITVPGVERLYLDFDSFFASAEQHFNKDLRGRPVGVVPLDSPHTSCIAVSREAKIHGVKSGAKITNARQIIPDMVFVIARHDVYVRLHKHILEVINTIVPVSKVRSIDEVVCNLLPGEAGEGKALSDRLKAALADEFSSTLTCSIGMAPTELLAKIGAEMNKPDGFALIQTSDLPGCLSNVDLGDLPGISKGMSARLAAAGVTNFTSLWALAPKQTRAIWGSVEGERFWNELHGFHAPRPETKKSMFGHSRLLPREWRTPDKVATCARQLALSAARRLRRENLLATRLTLGLRGADQKMRGDPQTARVNWTWEGVFPASRDNHTFLRSLSEGLVLAKKKVRFSPRSVSIMIHGLVNEDQLTGDLFGGTLDQMGRESGIDDRVKQEKLSDLMDALRKTHGAKAVSLGPYEEIPGGYVGAKIAFGRIPDEEDFNEVSSVNGETRFLSY